MNLKRPILCVVCLIVLGVSAPTQTSMPAAPAAMLDQVTGNWVLQGIIAGKRVTHDVQAAWVLNREYVQLHEISREKNPGGAPAYEATVYIGWDPKARQYVCLWLDSTSGEGLSSGTMGRADLKADAMVFLFTLSPADQIQTTFRYDKSAGTWQWLIDNVAEGKAQRFANVTLSRAK